MASTFRENAHTKWNVSKIASSPSLSFSFSFSSSFPFSYVPISLFKSVPDCRVYFILINMRIFLTIIRRIGEREGEGEGEREGEGKEMKEVAVTRREGQGEGEGEEIHLILDVRKILLWRRS